MKQEQCLYMLRILGQIGGPVKITYQTKQITLISEELIRYHIGKIELILESKQEFFKEYHIADIYSLYMCLDYIINDLGVDEFETIIGEDFYNSGLKFLFNLKQKVLNYYNK